MISPAARRAHDDGADGSVQQPAARLDLKVRPLQAQRGRVCCDRRAPSDLDADRAVDLVDTPLSEPETVRIRAWGQGALDVGVVSILVACEDPPLALPLEFMHAHGGIVCLSGARDQIAADQIPEDRFDQLEQHALEREGGT